MLDYADGCDMAGGDLNYRPPPTSMTNMYERFEELPPFPDDLVLMTGAGDSKGA